MRFVALMVVVLSALPAQSQENLPTAENLRVAAECGALIATLAPRADELKKRFDAFNAEVEAATGAKRRGTIYELGKQVPTREQMDRFEATLRDLKDRADELTAGCQNLATRQQALAIEGGLSHREEFCRNWYASLNQRVDCTSWKRLGQAFWPGRASCDAEPRRFGEGAGWWPQFRRNWENASAKQDKAAALEALYLSPASGNARERAIVVPRKFVTQSDGGPRKGPGARVVDTRALFAATHPSPAPIRSAK